MSKTIFRHNESGYVAEKFATMLEPVHKVIVHGGYEPPEVIRENSRKKGYEEGYEAGRKKGESEGYMAGIKRGQADGEKAARAEVAEEDLKRMDELKVALASLSDANEAALKEWVKQAEATLEDQVAELCRKVLCAELKLDRNSLLPMIAAAVREVANVQNVRVRINPVDHKFLVEQQEALTSLSAGLKNLEIIDDPEILGGAIVDTSGGTIDATLDQKLIALDAQVKIEKEGTQEAA